MTLQLPVLSSWALPADRSSPRGVPHHNSFRPIVVPIAHNHRRDTQRDQQRQHGVPDHQQQLAVHARIPFARFMAAPIANATAQPITAHTAMMLTISYPLFLRLAFVSAFLIFSAVSKCAPLSADPEHSLLMLGWLTPDSFDAATCDPVSSTSSATISLMLIIVSELFATAYMLTHKNFLR